MNWAENGVCSCLNPSSDKKLGDYFPSALALIDGVTCCWWEVTKIWLGHRGHKKSYFFLDRI